LLLKDKTKKASRPKSATAELSDGDSDSDLLSREELLPCKGIWHAKSLCFFDFSLAPNLINLESKDPHWPIWMDRLPISSISNQKTPIGPFGWTEPSIDVIDFSLAEMRRKKTRSILFIFIFFNSESPFALLRDD
jgi:hypothetical protein